MHIGITGATGFIGTALRRAAAGQQHTVTAFSRSPRPGFSAPANQDPWSLTEPTQPLDVLIHLAGESVLGLWTPAKKKRIHGSRVPFTENLVRHLASWKNPPPVLISASGIGYYGNGGDQVLTEDSPHGSGFLSGICQQWEAAAHTAAHLWQPRIATLRTGLVLGRGGAAFPLLHRVFRSGLGGRLGSGKQWMPWIHLEDVVGIILHLCQDSAISGPVNLCSPNPATNTDFTTTLAGVCRRPAFFHAPALMMRLLLGTMADEIFLSGQRAQPNTALNSGYRFQHPELKPALQKLVL